MKPFILSGSILILAGLIAATVIFHQNSREITYPQLGQAGNVQDNQVSDSEPEGPQTEQLQPVNRNEAITYTLQNNELKISFNNGNDWISVPVEKDELFGGEYNGNKQELIENSYILREDLAAFLYADGDNWESQRIILVYTRNKGQSWAESVVIEPYPGIRFRKIDFLNENFGYVIISGGRSMSQEGSSVFLTDDGGQSWKETNSSGVTRLISDGGFIDEKTGFLSFGTINPEEPDLHVTQDGGNTWTKAIVNVPEEYQQIFVAAETPVIEDDHLTVLVNQGPNGDYEGGLVKGKFISEDNGKTWEFLMEVIPDEAE